MDWLHEGEADLRRSRSGLSMEDYALSCFTAHQAVDKAMKALIIIIGVRRRTVPRTHDLTELLTEVEGLDLRVSDADLSDLSQYYVTSRYPNAGLRRPSLSFTRPQAERALRIAEEVVTDASRLLAA